MFALPPRRPFTWWQQSTFDDNDFSPVTKTCKELHFDM
jgi:hypothetical protein